MACQWHDTEYGLPNISRRKIRSQIYIAKLSQASLLYEKISLMGNRIPGLSPT